MAASILIDGRSGSGKTEFARAIAAQWPGAQLVRLDDLYHGWDGLLAGSEAVVTLLTEHRWRRWDWEASRLAEWHSVDPQLPILVEGCGALSGRNRELADWGLWVELDETSRKARAFERDGGAYNAHWDRWAAQEQAFIELEHPQSIADATIDGTDTNAAARQWIGRLRAM